MTELRINLTIIALTLAVVGGIGTLTEGLSNYLDIASNERAAADYTARRSAAPAPINSADASRPTAPAADKMALK